MPKLIKDGAIVDDDYTLVEPGEHGLALPAGNVLVKLATWLDHKALLLAHAGRKGVLLAPADNAAALAGDVAQLDLIAVDFPAFADGRGYSHAYLLRSRYGYTGELRAVGDVLKDTLYYQQRCGFNSFAVRADRDIEKALSGLRDFSEVYQASADQPRGLFHRRLN
jgi:uncharacterized protein (DUF934 family)